MRLNSIFILGFIFSFLLANAQWDTIPPTSSEHLNSCFFTSSSKGFVVGNAGTLLTSNDGGQSWNGSNSTTTEDLKSVYFLDVNNGFITGKNGTLLKTTNGGTNWSQTSISATTSLNDIVFYNSNEGIVIGDNGVIFTTSDGGNNWNEITPITIFILNHIKIVGDRAYIAAGNGTILYSYDKGANWNSFSAGHTEVLADISYLENDDELIFVGSNGKIDLIDTSDNTFSSAPIGTDWFKSIDCNNSTDCFAVNNKGEVFNNIPGNSWNLKRDLWNAPLNDIYFFNEELGFIVGNDGIILRTESGGLGVGIENHEVLQFNLFSNPAVNHLNVVIDDFTRTYDIEIFDLQGKSVLYYQNIVSATIQLNLNSGLYFVKISNDYQSATKKLVVK